MKRYALAIILFLIPSLCYGGYRYNSLTRKRDYCSTISNVSGDVVSDDCGDLKVEDGSLSEEDGFFLIKSGATTGGYVSMTTSTSTVDVSYGYIKKSIATDLAFQTGTLPDGNIGKILTIEITEIETVGDIWTLTPTTSTDFDSIVFDAIGDKVSLLYIDDTNGWIIISSNSADDIMNVPANTVSSDNIQDAIDELSDEKLDNIVEDLTPELGGTLDVVGNSIVDSSFDIINVDSDIYGDKIVSGRMLRQQDVWHAFGGFQDQTETLSIDAATWTFVTNATNTLWTGLEADGLTLIDDEMVIENTGDYIGTLSITFEGGLGKDYLFRIYNVTQAEVAGYHIGCAGAGNNNYTNVSIPIYLEATAGDHFQFQVYETNGTDAMFLNAVFWLNYLHD